MNKEEFIKELEKININVTEEQIQSLDKYCNLLIEENKKYNLTAITDTKNIYLKHFYDSLTITKAINLNNQYLLDIGTGAGFPGVVLKIFFPQLTIDLLDSTTKKCEFLNKLIKLLNLKNINVINERAEIYAKNNREKYDIVTSRAVAPLSHLLEYSIPVLKPNGIFISLKGNITEELTNIKRYYEKLFIYQEKIITFNLPKNQGYRSIYTIRKFKKTPLKYPRTYSNIKNHPL